MSQAVEEVGLPIRGPDTEAEEVEGRTPWQLFWGRFKQDKVALVGVAVIVILVLLGVFAPFISNTLIGRGPNDSSLSREMLDDFGLPTGPNSTYWFGADKAGRDLLVRVIYGARTSLQVAFFATGFSVAIGVVLGITAGFFGGVIDTLISRTIDIILSLPLLLFAIGIAATCSATSEGCTVFGDVGLPGPGVANLIVLCVLALIAAVGWAATRNSFFPMLSGALLLGWILLSLISPFHIRQGLGLVIFIISAFSWPYIARIVRGNTLSIREKEFVEASRSLGAGNLRIMFKEVLPNLVAPIIIYSTLIIPVNIIFEASLSFLGVGVPQSIPSWGRMLADSARILQVAPWMMIFPVVFLILTTLAFNLVGDGLRDAMDPRTGR